MLIKWLALGFKVYFTNAWCWLDFVIVMVSSNRISKKTPYTEYSKQFYFEKNYIFPTGEF